MFGQLLFGWITLTASVNDLLVLSPGIGQNIANMAAPYILNPRLHLRSHQVSLGSEYCRTNHRHKGEGPGKATKNSRVCRARGWVMGKKVYMDIKKKESGKQTEKKQQ